MGSALVSQLPLEILIQSDAPILARVSQLPIEVLTRPGTFAQLSQAPIEVLVQDLPATIARLSQAPVEVALLSDLPIDLRISQLPLELLVFAVARGWRVTIDGVNRTTSVDAVNVTDVMNERSRATIVLGDVLPAKGAEVVCYAKDGITRIFGGIVLTRRYTGRNQYDPTFTVSLECGDYFTYTDWLHATLTYSVPVTLKAVLQDLVSTYLSAYSIVLHPGQVDGPELAPFVWKDLRISDALRELTDRTGYVVRLNGAKVLRMFFPGTDPAPFTLTEAAPHCQDVTWADTDQTGANFVRIIAGPNGQRDVENEIHNGDGVTTIFPLYAPYVTIIGALSEMRDGVLTGMYFPVGVLGVDDPTLLAYMYNPANNAIVPGGNPRPVLAANEGFNIWYGAMFPFEVTASTGATPVIEYSEARPDVMSIPAAQEIANGILAKLGTAPREVAITTDEDGFEPGQALMLDLPVTRSIAGPFTITEVGMTIVQDTGPDDEYWVYTLKAIESTKYQGSYLDDWRRLTVAPSTITDGDPGGTGRQRRR